MDESAGKSAGDGGSGENKAIQSTADENQTGSKAGDGTLPVVWSPKLAAGEAAADGIEAGAEEPMASSTGATKDKPGGPGGEQANDAAVSRSLRFAMLAASLAAAAALGSFVGSLSVPGVGHFWPAGGANSVMAATGGPQAAKAEVAEPSALKANLDNASRGASSQLAKLAERLDRAEHAQAESAAKLTHIAEAIDRLEKKSMTASPATAADTTGSVSMSPPAPPAEAKPPENVLRDWIVQDARGGRALVGNRYGAIFDIAAGSVVPGLGRVEAIKRQDGQWIVVTARGVIYSAP